MRQPEALWLNDRNFISVQFEDQQGAGEIIKATWLKDHYSVVVQMSVN